MKEMTLEEHLTELRGTMIRVMIILSGAFVLSYCIGDKITEFLLIPLREALRAGGGQIVYLGILDKILTQFQLAFWAGILLSSPLWFWEIWKFIRPGLLEHEVKVVRPFICVGFCLFVLGILFGYYIVFPLAFETLLNFGVQDVAANLSLKDYVLLASKSLAFLGLIFQLPNIMLIMGFMGLVTKYSLRSMRRYVYFVMAIVSALITPPDVITMLGLWIPLMFLYEIGVLAVAFIVHPYLAKHYS